MKDNNKWVKLVLAASLALNLAFAGPYIYHKFFTHTKHQHEEPGHQVKLKTGLNLRDEQKEQLDKIVIAFKLNLLEYKQDILEKRIAIIDELVDPEFDPETITARTNELNELGNELNLLFVETLVQINTLLEPEQRLNFLYRVSKNWFFIDKSRRKRRTRSEQ